MSIIGGSLRNRNKNFIAYDCFTVIVVHTTIKNLTRVGCSPQDSSDV